MASVSAQNDPTLMPGAAFRRRQGVRPVHGCLAAFTLLLASPATHAQTIWTGNSGTGRWSDRGNWNTGVVPPENTDVVFNGDAKSVTVLLDFFSQAVRTLTFNNASDGLAKSFRITNTLSTGTSDNILYVGVSGIVNNTAALQTIDASVYLPVGSASTITFNAAVAGGTLAFTGNSINPYNVLRLGGNRLAVTGAGDTVIASPIQGTGGLTKTGTGTLTLSGTNTYTSSTTVSGGTLLINGDTALGAGTVSLSNAKLGVTTSGTTISRDMSLIGADSRFTGAADFMVSGQLSGSGNLIKSGTGTLTLSRANSYTGTTTISGGTLLVADTTALGSNTGAVLLSGGSFGVSVADASITRDFNVVGMGNGFTGDNGFILKGSLSGDGSLTKTGSGTITIYGGGNTFSGNLAISAGGINLFAYLGGATINNNSSLLTYLDMAANISIINGPDATISMVPAYFNSIGSLSGSGTILVGLPDFRVGVLNKNDIFSGVMQDYGSDYGEPKGGLVKVGTGTLTLLGANSYTQGTFVRSGTLLVGDATHPNAQLGTGAVQNGATLVFQGGTVSKSSTINNNGSLTFRDSASAGNIRITNNALTSLIFLQSARAGSATVTNNGATIFSGSSSADTANITNNATLGFTGNSSAGSATITNTGTLSLEVTSSANEATVVNNGTVDLGYYTGTGVSIGSLSGAGPVNLYNKALTLGGVERNDALSGVVEGAGV